jgi:glycosyltransferase involved in cell wall biosynthesis
MTDDKDQLEELREKARLQEYVFSSKIPVFGGLITWFRKAWNSVATKWYVRPLIDQQTAFNLAVVDRLSQQQKVLDAGAVELESWLVQEDREQIRLTRQVAELAVRSAQIQRSAASERPLRIAYFSPFPPARSGIADYSTELLPYLARQAAVTIFSNDLAIATTAGVPVVPVAEYPACRHQFDLALYQMGNSEHHDYIYETLIRYPGIVVLHDYSLHHFVRHHTQRKSDWTGYGRELAYSLGEDGWNIARAVRVEKTLPALFDEPLNERVIDVSLGILVHSHYAATGVGNRRPEMPLAVISPLIEPHEGHSRRAMLGISEHAVIFGSFGQMTAEKQIEPALRAFSRVRETYPDAHYLIVGEAMPDIREKIEGLITESSFAGFVHLIGYVPGIDEFVDWLHTADVVVNLRHPTAGETSAIALRAMAAAKPLIVHDRGWYGEIRDEMAIKVAPHDSDSLQAAMLQLAESVQLRRAMGQAGQDYTRTFCHPEKVADSYIQFLGDTLERLGSIPA